MSPSLAHFLTRLHSPKWQARYGGEFEALLIDLTPSAATMADVVGSAVSSRRATLVLAMAIAAMTTFIFTAHHSKHATEAVQVHVPACAAYSSVPNRSHRCSLG